MKINMLNAQKCGNLHWSTQTACFVREMNQNELGTCEVTHWNLKDPHLGSKAFKGPRRPIKGQMSPFKAMGAPNEGPLGSK